MEQEGLTVEELTKLFSVLSHDLKSPIFSVDGFSEFKLLNITPGRPVVILRRMDYVYGDYELEMSVNGKKVSIVSCVGTDRVHRWRNWPAMIPQDAVADGTLLVRQQSVTAGRDINMFHIWVYQPK